MSTQQCPELAVQTWDLLTKQNLTHRPLVVALSGGLDSMVMLRVMLELRSQKGLSFSAIHINHGLSANADRWQSFVETYCEINQVPLVTSKLSLEKKPRQSLEHIARDARYANMAAKLPEQSVIMTGHHLHDQVETFFLRLSRGSSAKGLSAMSVISHLPHRVGRDKSQVLLRPLLKSSKSLLETYAACHFLDWIEDESNQDVSFDRNFIRHQVTPILEKKWPHFSSAIATSCEILNEESQLLEEYLRQDLIPLLTIDKFEFTKLTLPAWRDHSVVKQIQLLRLFLKNETGSQINRNQVDQIIESVIDAKQDKQGVLNIGKFQVRKHGDYLYCFDEALIKKRAGITSVVFEACIHNENNLIAHLSLDSALYNQDELKLVLKGEQPICRCVTDQKWSLEFGMRNSLKIKPNKNSGHKKVTEYLKQQGCPAWLRDQVPLLFCENELIAIIDYAIDESWQNKLTYEIKRT